jgi:hypothetical protein
VTCELAQQIRSRVFRARQCVLTIAEVSYQRPISQWISAKLASYLPTAVQLAGPLLPRDLAHRSSLVTAMKKESSFLRISSLALVHPPRAAAVR